MTQMPKHSGAHRTLFDEFRSHTLGSVDPELHANLTLLAYLALLPDATRLQVTSPPGIEGFQIAHSGPGSHGSFAVSRAGASLKSELRRWIERRELARSAEENEFAFRSATASAPPDEL